MENKNLLSTRAYYKPYWYQDAQNFTKSQQRVHWVPDEVSLASDLNDWNSKLTESEKNLIGNILKSFAQTEIHVGNDYWIGKVATYFKLPEIQEMAVTFAAMECIHAESYSRLNEDLGLDDFSAFLEDETTKNKIDYLVETEGETLYDKALSLAIFSAFTEGVNLFSSFAVLMSFQLRNLMKGTGQIVAWSVRDESLHSQAGCWLFRTLLSENPHINTPELSKAIYDACNMSIQLEFNFIEKAFEMGDIEGLTQEQLKNFIKERANQKLTELGFHPLYEDINSDLLNQMSWFGSLTSGVEQQDFFAGRSTSYSISTSDWSDL